MSTKTKPDRQSKFQPTYKNKLLDSAHEENPPHKTHPEAILRLRRAGGHLNKVVSMIETKEPCTDILQQLTAVISALSGCRVMLLQDHVDSCLRAAIKPGNEKLIDDIDSLLKRTFRGT